MPRNAPECQPCSQPCCEFIASSVSLGGHDVKLFEMAYVVLAAVSVVFWVVSLPRARTKVMDLYFKFLLLGLLAFVTVVLLHLLPQTGSGGWESLLAVMYAAALVLEWFVQVAVVTFMLESGTGPSSIRWSVIRAGSASLVCGCVWVGGVFTQHMKQASLIVEICILLFFVITGIQSIKSSNERSNRPALRYWCTFMACAHALFLLNYAFTMLSPASEICSCSDIISMFFYYLFYAPLLFWVLARDTTFWREGGGAIMSAASAWMPIAETDETNLFEPDVLEPTLGNIMEAAANVSIPQFAKEDMELLGALGVGQFANVSQGRLKESRELVAIKEFKVAGADMWHNSAVALLQEVQVISKLNHPNIVAVVGMCLVPPSATDEIPVIRLITELATRGALFDAISAASRPNKHGNVADTVLTPMRVRWNILADIASGCQYLHSQNPAVLHRDIKSPNVLLSIEDVGDGECLRAKLCDFGVSRLKMATGTMTSVGTPQWMAPEVLRGERYSECADMYSFGVVAWELGSLAPPFQGVPPLRVISMVAYEGIGLPPIARQNVPMELSDIIQGCTRVHPRRRLTAAAVLARATAALAAT